MPSTVAVVRKAVNSSRVSKVFRLPVYSRNEVLVVLDVDVHDIVVAIGPSCVEVVPQGGVGTVTRQGEEHVVDAVGAE